MVNEFRRAEEEDAAAVVGGYVLLLHSLPLSAFASMPIVQMGHPLIPQNRQMAIKRHRFQGGVRKGGREDWEETAKDEDFCRRLAGYIYLFIRN